MTGNAEHVSYFAHSNHREPLRTFGIKQADRLSHMYVIGKTGAGKTTLLETLITQDRAGSVCLDSFQRSYKWFSALVMLPPGLAAAD